jgi:cytochrome c oxidase cbb3-type subunit 3
MSSSILPGTPGSSEAAPARAARANTAPPEPDLLDHEYDGIREYDSPMPGWWVAVFWATFFFSIGYAFHYHASGNGVSVAEAYRREMAAARAEQSKRALGEKVSEAGLGKVMADPALMADAKVLFAQRCAQCHADQGQGQIGPNLTDHHWLHGSGTLLDIHKVVSDGVPEKGMPPWSLQLTPVQVSELAAFVGTLRGKNLPGKAPEGTLVTAPP